MTQLSKNKKMLQNLFKKLIGNKGNQERLFTLESRVFPNASEKRLFKEWLEANDSINPIFVGRRRFNNLKGDFLKKTKDGGGVVLDSYDLYLPNDLQVGEIINIISKVDEVINNGGFRTFNSIKQITKTVIAYLYKYGGLTQNDINDLKKKFNISDDLSDKIEHETKIKPTEQVKDLIRRFRQQIKDNTKNPSSKELTPQELLSQIVSEEYSRHLGTTFFERGTKNLYDYMTTFTQLDFDNLDPKEIKKRKIVLNKTRDQLDKEVRKLSDSIGISQLRQELEEARKINDEEKISQAEVKATNIIIRELHKFPWQKFDNSYTPSHILKTKQFQCVGASILGHSFLSELGIKHYGLNLPDHSALLVKTSNGDEYYFDISDYLTKLTGHPVNQIGECREYPTIMVGNEPLQIQIGSAEIILQSQIWNNTGGTLNELRRYQEAIKYIDKALEINPKHYGALINRGNALNALRKYQEAIKYYDKALEINPKYYGVWNNKGGALYGLGKYQEAIKYYDKALEINPKDDLAWYNKGNALSALLKYQESIEYYDKALEINPKYYGVWNNKGIVLRKLGKNKEAKIYYFVSDILSGNYLINLITIFDSKEKKHIRNLIKQEKFNEMRDYVFSLKFDE